MWKKTRPKGGRYITVYSDRHMPKTVLDSESWPLNASNNENPNRNVITYSTGFLSSRPNWVTHTPSPARECCSFPPFGAWERDTLACGGGGGGPDSDEGTDTLALYICTLYYNPSTTYIIKGTLGICGVWESWHTRSRQDWHVDIKKENECSRADFLMGWWQEKMDKSIESFSLQPHGSGSVSASAPA